jgi:tetratricopeptide (TPR) repeat protein
MRILIAVTVAALATAGCTAKAPQSAVSGTDATDGTTGTLTSTATTFGERYDAQQEEVVATDSLAAWRVAVKHAKQKDMPKAEWDKQRQADEKQSMAMLKDLEQRYPKSSTVQFMMGQVADHFGKHAEAASYFGKSTENNTHNSMYLFKLAEAESKAGQYDKAINHYQQIQEQGSGEWFVKLGLARALKAKNAKDAEADKLLEQVLQEQPDNAEAKSLLSGK